MAENHQPPTDSPANDADIKSKRQKAFNKIMWGPMLSSASQLMSMFGGPMLGAGLLALIGFGGGAGVVTTAAIAVTAVGAALQIAGVVINYMGARNQNDGWMDQTEVGAMTNARCLVKELKANSMCLVEEHSQNQREDGKQWQDVVAQKQHLQLAK